MTERMYGYVHVSTRIQKKNRQLAALTQFGVAEEDMVVEKQSGMDFRHPVLCSHKILSEHFAAVSLHFQGFLRLVPINILFL